MIVFRVDSSTQIGSGHLMRCLTLAGQLKKKKQTEIVFVSRDLDGNMNFLIMKNHYSFFCLPKSVKNRELSGYEKWLMVDKVLDAKQTKNILQGMSVDCLIIDSYAIDEAWEKILRPCTKKIMVIDDLANRRHDCDVLLDQNYYTDMLRRYDGLVPKHCKMLLGPQHVLLREEFYEERTHLRVRDGRVQTIFVFFGGSDLTNETMKTLHAIVLLIRFDIKVDVVIGSSNKHKAAIEDFCRKYSNITCYYQVVNIAELMNKADLAIGAGGSTTWERCFLGLPTIVISVAENQTQLSENCSELGIIKYMGQAEEVSVKSLSDTIHKMISSQVTLGKLILKINQIKSSLFKV